MVKLLILVADVFVVMCYVLNMIKSNKTYPTHKPLVAYCGRFTCTICDKSPALPHSSWEVHWSFYGCCVRLNAS